MKVEVKFGTGDEVYAVFKEKDTVQVIKDKIVEFSYSIKHGLSYYIDTMFDDFKEDEIIAVDDKEGLVKKIDELLERGE